MHWGLGPGRLTSGQEIDASPWAQILKAGTTSHPGCMPKTDGFHMNEHRLPRPGCVLEPGFSTQTDLRGADWTHHAASSPHVSTDGCRTVS